MYNLAITPKSAPLATLQSASFSALCNHWDSFYHCSFAFSRTPNKWSHSVLLYLFFLYLVVCIWFLSSNIMLFRFVLCCYESEVCSFIVEWYLWRDIPQYFILLSWWIFGLFPGFDYCNKAHSIVFLHFFAVITEEGFLISPWYSLECCIQMGIFFLFSFVFPFPSFHSYL